MSYQPQPPSPQMSTVVMPSAPTPALERKPRLLTLLGVAALVGGVIAAVVLYVLSGSSDDEAAKKLARAPVGCTTTLQFDRSGTFVLFVETKGSLGDVGGDCPVKDQSYDSSGSEPEVTLALVDSDESALDLVDRAGISYDAGGFKGTSIATVRIDDPGSYRLTVESDDADFVIAIGTDPNEAADSMMTLAIIVLAIGVVLGVILIVLGQRRRATPAPAAEVWQAQPPHQPQPSDTTMWQPQPAAQPATQPGWPPQPAQPAAPPDDPFGRPPSV